MVNEKSNESIVDSNLLAPFCIPESITGIEFHNINSGSKGVPKMTFVFNDTNMDLSKAVIGSQTVITRYRDVYTGYYVTDLPFVDYDANDPSTDIKFRYYVLKLLKQAWDVKYHELKHFHDTDVDKYKDRYRDLELVKASIDKQLSATSGITKIIRSGLQDVTPVNKKRVNINSRLAFKDTQITESLAVTRRVPYNTPQLVPLSVNDNKFKLVKDILSVFVDDDNFYTLLWFFGSLLANASGNEVPKMLVVSSSKGGNGKNTLIEGLCKGLLTTSFYDVKSTFDSYFDKNNRFAGSLLYPVHAIIFSEAEWNTDPKANEYNMNGLAIGKIKSLISDGIYLNEAKFKSAYELRSPYTRLITLTNHFPVINDETNALNRRILPLIVKPSTMAEKGRQLNLKDKDEFAQLITDNAQTIANVCYSFYMQHKNMYADYLYSHDDSVKAVQKSTAEYEEAKTNSISELRRLAQTDINAALTKLGKQNNIDFSNLIAEITSAKPNPELVRRVKMDTHCSCYINSANNALLSLTGNANARKVLKQVFGNPIMKFHKRMFRIDQLIDNK